MGVREIFVVSRDCLKIEYSGKRKILSINQLAYPFWYDRGLQKN